MFRYKTYLYLEAALDYFKEEAILLFWLKKNINTFNYIPPK